MKYATDATNPYVVDRYGDLFSEGYFGEPIYSDNQNPFTVPLPDDD